MEPTTPQLSNAYSVLQQAKIDFQMFSTLSPRTWVHLYPGKNGDHFQPIGGTNSCYYGAQFLASYVNGYTPNVFFNDFSKFTKRVIDAVSEIFENGKNTSDLDIKQRSCQELQLINSSMKSAISKTNGSGLYGLLETHKKDAIYTDLQAAIDNLKTTIEKAATGSKAWLPEDFTESQITGTSNKLNSPEAKFTDEEWEREIEVSSKFISESPGIKKYALYSTSLVCEQTINAYVQGAKWNEIMKFPNGPQLHLGSLPLIVGAIGCESRNDLKELQTLGIGAVLSMNQKFETDSPGMIISPVTANDYAEAGIKQLQILTPDRESISIENIDRAVEFIHWIINKKKLNLLVHCKQGKSRSSTVVMAYLIKYHSYTADNAYDFVHEKRPASHFDENRKNVLRDYEEKCKDSRF